MGLFMTEELHYTLKDSDTYRSSIRPLFSHINVVTLV